MSGQAVEQCAHNKHFSAALPMALYKYVYVCYMLLPTVITISYKYKIYVTSADHGEVM